MKFKLFKISLITLSVICFSNFAFSQEINKTDPQGNKQGIWEKKDKVGRLVYKGSFKDNLPEGTFTYYDTTGKVKAITEFSQNGSNAYTKMFDKGFKESEGLFVNEKKQGVWKYYNHDSIVIAEENYKNGVPDGVWKTFYANGQLLDEIPYVNGVKEGTWTQYFYDGRLKTKATYVNGLLEGLATFYHPNGRVFISGPYLHNLKDGTWIHLNDKGETEKKEIWKSGTLAAEEYYDKKLEKMAKEEK